MFTYLIMNLLFMLVLIMFLPKKLSKPGQAFWMTLIVLLVLTSIFDPIIIGLDIVGYDDSLLLGLKWFGAPIEDFFYAIFAACAVPLVWNRFAERDVKEKAQ